MEGKYSAEHEEKGFDLKEAKTRLVNTVCASMIAEPRFDNQDDTSATTIVTLVEQIALADPEFILKLAVYVRNDLNVRSTANFLVALAANSTPCSVFLKKYFRHIVRLPSDWLDIAALYQMLPNRTLRGRAIPTALRKAMKFKFPEFDTYQLGKYNKQGKIKRMKKKAKKAAAAGKPIPEQKGGKTQLTVKQMIRQLHITEPVDNVMAVLGKKYPANETEFRRSGLTGTFDPARAGKRLKLPVPETWETLLSAKGNKADTWQELIDHKKLPFMAMLRNLRNLILTGVDYKYHRWAMNKLNNEGAVANSRQFPFTFFSAYEAINVDLEKLKEEIKIAKAAGGKPGQAVKAKVEATPARGRGKPARGARGGRGGRGGAAAEEPRRVKKFIIPKNMPDDALIKKYREALDNAVKFATVHNVKPIRGSTVVFCSVSDSMSSGLAKNAKGMGSVRTQLDIGVLLGLMCKYMCEECDFRIFAEHRGDAKCHLPVELVEGTILDNMRTVAELAKSGTLAGGSEFPFDYVEDLIRDRKVIDNFIVLSNNMIAPGYEEMTHLNAGGISGILRKYRQEVNPDLLFVSVNLDGTKRTIERSGPERHPNDVLITGFTDAILKYIAERGDSNQLHAIEHIDEAKGIRDPPKKAPKNTRTSGSVYRSSLGGTSRKKVSFGAKKKTTFTSKPFSFDDSSDSEDEKKETEAKKGKKAAAAEATAKQVEEAEHKKRVEKLEQMRSGKWRQARLFVSSTFRDMHGERDWLVRYVFPELKERCRKRKVNFYDVDLRWGVTEREAEEGASLEICLDEVDRCRPFFLGILGDRYGWVPEQYQLPEDPRYLWTKKYPKGRSITELEMYYGAMHDPDQTQAFFYYRDPAFLNNVPEERGLREEFAVESPKSAEKMKELRSMIETRYQPKTYRCGWGGIVEGKPMTNNLAEFGRMVLEDLWSSICKTFPAQTVSQDPIAVAREPHENFYEAHVRRFVGRDDLLKQLNAWVNGEAPGPMVVTGDPGSGKSALMAQFIKQYTHAHPDSFVLYHFVGASSDSNDVRHMILRVCRELVNRFKVNIEVPEEYNDLKQIFPRVLEESCFLSKNKIVIVLDAINQLTEKERAHTLDWLPSGTKARIIVSTYQGSKTHDVLRYRKPVPPQVTVGALEEKHARNLVSAALWEFRKKLDESPGNNQMRFLLRKADAIKPLFLVVACEELRVFGVYEKLTSKVKSLAPSVPKLFDEVLLRLESDQNKQLLKTTLSLIACGRGGLLESEVLAMLARDASEKELPMALWSPLYSAVRPFLKPRGDLGEGMLDFFHGQMMAAVRKRYFSTRTQEPMTHKLIANYYLKQLGFASSTSASGTSAARRPAITKGKEKESDTSSTTAGSTQGVWKKVNGNPEREAIRVRALSELPYHLTKAQMWSDFGSVVCNLEFVEAKSQLGLTFDLVADLSDAVHALESVESDAKAKIEDFYRFVSSDANILRDHPELTFQQAANQPNDTAPALASLQVAAAAGATAQLPTWVKWHNKPKKQNACTMTLAGNAQPVMAVAVSPDGTNIVTAGRDQTLRICDAVTGLEISTLIGHTNWVVACAYAPQGDKIVSASWDETLKIWDARAGVEISTLKGHTRRVNTVAYSTDGRRIVSGSWDCSVRIWDASSGKLLQTLTGHTKPVNAVSFSPDDKMVVSASWDCSLKIWDLESGKEARTLQGHTKSVRSVRFSPTGHQIVSTSVDTTVRVWDVRTGAVTVTLTGHSKPVNTASFSADGKHLVSASEDLTVKVWDALGGREVNTLKAGDLSINAIDISPDEQRIAAALADCSISVWDAFIGEVAFSLQGHTRTINAVSFNPSGTRIVSAADDGSVRVWNAKTGEQELCITGHKDCVNDAVFSPDGDVILTASDDYTLCMWDAFTGELQQEMRGHTNRVVACTYSPDGRRIASAARDNTLRIWDPNTGTVKKILMGHQDWLTDCSFSADGKRLVSGSWDFNVKVWDVKKGKELATLRGHMGAVSGVAFSESSQHIISASFDGTLRLWDARELHEITTMTGHGGRVNCVRFARHGNKIVSGSDEGAIKVWDAEAGQEVTTFQGHSDTVREVTYSPDKKAVVSASDDCTVKVWDATAEVEDVHGHSQWINACALSRDGRTLATASRDQTIKLWDTRAKKVRNTLEGHTKSVNAVDISPDGSRVVSGSDDFSVVLWDAKSGEALRTMKGHTNAVRTVQFAPDGGRIASASWDNTVRIWDMRGNLLITLTHHNDWVDSLAFSPDGNRIVTGGRDNRVVVCDSFSGRAIATFDRHHTNWISAVAFASDASDRVASGSYDTSVAVYDVKRQTKVATLTGHAKRVHTVAFTPDGKHVLSASADRTVRVWNPTARDQQCVSRFFCRAPATALAVSPGAAIFAAGDSLGNVYIFELMN